MRVHPYTGVGISIPNWWLQSQPVSFHPSFSIASNPGVPNITQNETPKSWDFRKLCRLISAFFKGLFADWVQYNTKNSISLRQLLGHLIICMIVLQSIILLLCLFYARGLIKGKRLLKVHRKHKSKTLFIDTALNICRMVGT